ncbi:hypothetical protein [Nostoc sp. JL23]|uniref:hypothetical protein n=1 Tax=Nostoc sp. JL23 TaxID=2815394 RepID=UPI001E147012|nr:hypothetical protein [Nostoc sp. JL23]MBN3878804.1 hypothetical protein [Nostoc sp. JL23]
MRVATDTVGETFLNTLKALAASLYRSTWQPDFNILYNFRCWGFSAGFPPPKAPQHGNAIYLPLS